MLTIKQIKRDVRYIEYIDYIFYKAQDKNSIMVLYLSSFISIISTIFVFLDSNLMSAIANFIFSFLTVFIVSLFFLMTPKEVKNKKWEKEIFSKLKQKELKRIKKIENKISKPIKKYIETKELKKDKVYDIYSYLLMNEKMTDILNNLEEIIEDTNKNDRKDLKFLLFKYIIKEIDKVDFNNNKNKIIKFIEKEFDNKNVIHFLEEMKKLKLKYDDEEINKYKNQLKEDISTNKIPKEKKLIQSI